MLYSKEPPRIKLACDWFTDKLPHCDPEFRNSKMLHELHVCSLHVTSRIMSHCIHQHLDLASPCSILKSSRTNATVAMTYLYNNALELHYSRHQTTYTSLTCGAHWCLSYSKWTALWLLSQASSKEASWPAFRKSCDTPRRHSARGTLQALTKTGFEHLWTSLHLWTSWRSWT